MRAVAFAASKPRCGPSQTSMKYVGRSTVNVIPLSRTRCSTARLPIVRASSPRIPPENDTNTNRLTAGTVRCVDEVQLSLVVGRFEAVAPGPRPRRRDGAHDGIDAAAGRIERPAILDVAADRVRTQRLQFRHDGGIRRRSDQRAHRDAAAAEPATDLPPEKTSGPGNQ